LLYKETLFIGTPGDMLKMALKMGISYHRSPTGELGAGGSFTRDSERCMNESSGNGATREDLQGELEGGLLYWRP